MNKKIKVIELLENISKGIKIPKKIYFNGYNYELQRDEKTTGYYRSVWGANFISFTTDFSVLNILNDYVEYLDEENKETDLETKLFEEIAMCLKRLSDKDLTAKPYVDRYEYALKKYKDKKINKEE